MLLNALIICISIQFVMAYHFGLAQVQRDSAYKWIERSVILSFTSNILIVTALIQSGMQYYLNTGERLYLWAVGAIAPIYFMHITYRYWIKHKLLVRNGYIKTNFYL